MEKKILGADFKLKGLPGSRPHLDLGHLPPELFRFFLRAVLWGRFRSAKRKIYISLKLVTYDYVESTLGT